MKDIFSNKENIYLISPILKNVKKSIVTNWETRSLESHVFLLSSGTTAREEYKTFALSKNAILANAMAVNRRFSIKSSDRWLSSLPNFHIGGLSIFARAMLSQSEVIETSTKWNPINLVSLVEIEKINYFSLVPTQLFDIISNDLTAPSCVKGVFIGGDFVSTALCLKAKSLGWPLLITFGMTELCSQIATSKFENIENEFLETYDIHNLIKKGNEITIDSPSLFTEEIIMNSNTITRVKAGSEFKLLDLIDLKMMNGRTFLKPLGRTDDVFKLSGRLYHLNHIIDSTAKQFLDLKLLNSIYYSLENDERLGKIIIVNCLESIKSDQKIIETIIEQNLSIPLRYFRFKFLNQFTKTELGKIKKFD